MNNINLSKIETAIIVKAVEEDNHRGWFLGKENSGGILGEFDVKIYETYDKCKDLVALLLHLSSLWGIGAKTQEGFGICEFEGDYSLENAISRIKGLIDRNQISKSYDNDILPNLEDFFFVKIIIKEDIEDKIKNVLTGKLYKKVKNYQIDIDEFLKSIPEDYRGQFYPTAPLIRYWLRGLFRNGNDDLRHFLLGFVSIKGNPTPLCKKHLTHIDRDHRCYICKRVLRKENYFEKMASKIFVSHIYKLSSDDQWEFKIWGYIPKILPNNENRENILQKLFSEIKEHKNFASILNLDKNSVEVEWYEISQKRSPVSSVEELIREVVGVNKND